MEEKEFISIQVRNPRTHLKNRWTSFTDYEVVVSTNSMAFALQESRVRRRFSEFEWLRRTLAKTSSISIHPPPLPNKGILGRFSQDFLEKRRASLEEFLTKVVSIITYLSEAALHLFLQSTLTIKEIERFLEGKDRRDVAEIICQKNEVNNRISRKDSEVTNADSGYSGSNNLDSHMPGCVWQCKDLGNGWSSGYTNMSDSLRQKKLPCLLCLRKSNPFRTASVLPSGQLLVAEDTATKKGSNGSISSCERCPDESCSNCNQYDADDETDQANSFEYDIINAKKIRFRDWLSKVTPERELETSKNDCSKPAVPRARSEYDEISVPCLRSSSLNTMSSRSASDDGTSEAESRDGSCYSVVHSTIGGGLKLEKYEKCESSSTLSSAEIYRSYDVVEMVELLD